MLQQLLKLLLFAADVVGAVEVSVVFVVFATSVVAVVAFLNGTPEHFSAKKRRNFYLIKTNLSFQTTLINLFSQSL